MAEATGALQAVLWRGEADGDVRGSVVNVRGFEDAITGAARRPLLARPVAVVSVRAKGRPTGRPFGNHATCRLGAPVA
jgi:hypothetical protein